mmetsp:Transcript_56277/g.136425  ORF Transcript_56277/g.136425 Transcript_56277/m.136425 type:complete len:95 (-) Transcript_56277:53-337(-)
MPKVSRVAAQTDFVPPSTFVSNNIFFIDDNSFSSLFLFLLLLPEAVVGCCVDFVDDEAAEEEGDMMDYLSIFLSTYLLGGRRGEGSVSIIAPVV